MTDLVEPKSPACSFCELLIGIHTTHYMAPIRCVRQRLQPV